MTLNFIDLFCGAGGFSYGLTKAGLKHICGVDDCSDSSHIQQTYEANCGLFVKCNIKDYIAGNIYKNKIDVVVGSPPCKSFSTANIKTRTMDLTLIKEFMRVVEEINPKYWVWENVNSVQQVLTKQSNLNGDNFLQKGHWQSYNMNEYGMLQMRKRTFVSNVVLDIPKTKHDFLDGNRAWGVYCHDRSNILRPIYTVTAHGSKRGGNFGLHLFERRKGLRHLTVEELANIQTFPFYYKFFGSHTSIETQIGNAVPPHFAYLIGKKLLELEEK